MYMLGLLNYVLQSGVWIRVGPIRMNHFEFTSVVICLVNEWQPEDKLYRNSISTKKSMG